MGDERYIHAIGVGQIKIAMEQKLNSKYVLYSQS